MSLQENKARKIAYIVIPVVYLILLVVILLGYFNVIPLTDTILLALLYIGLGLTVMLLVAFLILWIMNRKVESSDQKLKPQSTGTFQPKKQSRRDYQKIDSRIKSSTPKLFKNKLSFELLYKGERDGIICAICQIDLEEHQTCYECPNCKAVFHAQHILEWLTNETTCPICKFNLEKYII